MNRFTVISIALHGILLGAFAITSRSSFKPIPKLETYRVSIAPMPQPKVFGAPDVPVEPEVIKEPQTKPEEKKPPPEKKETAAKDTKKTEETKKIKETAKRAARRPA
jgi:hypothetical protein